MEKKRIHLWQQWVKKIKFLSQYNYLKLAQINQNNKKNQVYNNHNIAHKNKVKDPNNQEKNLITSYLNIQVNNNHNIVNKVKITKLS